MDIKDKEYYRKEAKEYLTSLLAQREEIDKAIKHFEGVIDGSIDPTK